MDGWELLEAQEISNSNSVPSAVTPAPTPNRAAADDAASPPTESARDNLKEPPEHETVARRQHRDFYERGHEILHAFLVLAFEHGSAAWVCWSSTRLAHALSAWVIAAARVALTCTELHASRDGPAKLPGGDCGGEGVAGGRRTSSCSSASLRALFTLTVARVRESAGAGCSSALGLAAAGAARAAAASASAAAAVRATAVAVRAASHAALSASVAFVTASAKAAEERWRRSYPDIRSACIASVRIGRERIQACASSSAGAMRTGAIFAAGKLRAAGARAWSLWPLLVSALAAIAAMAMAVHVLAASRPSDESSPRTSMASWLVKQQMHPPSSAQAHSAHEPSESAAEHDALSLDAMKEFAAATCIKQSFGTVKQFRSALRSQFMAQNVPSAVAERLVAAAAVEGASVTSSFRDTEHALSEQGRGHTYLAFFSTRFTPASIITSVTSGETELRGAYETCYVVSGVDIEVEEQIVAYQEDTVVELVGVTPCHCGLVWCEKCPDYRERLLRRPIFRRQALTMRGQEALATRMAAKAVEAGVNQLSALKGGTAAIELALKEHAGDLRLGDL